MTHEFTLSAAVYRQSPQEVSVVEKAARESKLPERIRIAKASLFEDPVTDPDERRVLVYFGANPLINLGHIFLNKQILGAVSFNPDPKELTQSFNKLME